MSDEIQILISQIDSMAAIFNAVPGEVFRLRGSDTLLILQRRMQASDLFTALCRYNEIFSKTKGARISDIEKSATAYIRIKCLVNAKTSSYTPILQRQLIKEYKNQMTKVSNIIHLSKVNALTADDYQKENIRLMQEKNEAFLVAFQREIDELEKRIERTPSDESESVAHIRETLEADRQEKKDTVNHVVGRISNLITEKKKKRDVEERLREEEKKQALTRCEEIPYYDANLLFTEAKRCKDIPAYSILKRKNNVYFGLSKNVGNSRYDNRDQSLIELTNVTEEFLQYMTEDMLSGEYELKPFCENEKQSLQMYFEFMSKCFEQHIGVTLTVQEYLQFKAYYNKVVLMMFELERTEKEDYYKALMLAETYISYMESYDLKCVDNKETIIANLISEENGIYLDDIDLIISNHIVEPCAKEDLQVLKRKITEIHQSETKEEIQVIDTNTESDVEMPRKPYGGYFPQTYGMPVLPGGVMQIVVQILNQNHEVVDEALYAGNNIKQALYDYEARNAQIKRLGFRSNGTDVFYKEEVR